MAEATDINPKPPSRGAVSSAFMWLTFGAVVIACVGIGAWLVTKDHPWFGFLAMLIGASISVKSND